MAQAMVVLGPDKRIRAFNRRAVELFQLPPEAFADGVDFRDTLRIWATNSGQDAAMLERAIRELDLPEPFTFEFIQDVGGEPRWCQLFHNPLPDGGVVRTFSDITERKEAEERIARQTALLEAVMANMAQGMVVADGHMRLQALNPQFLRLFPWVAADVAVGADFTALVAAWADRTGQSAETREQALRRLRERTPFTAQFAQVVDGAETWVEVHHTPMPDGGFVRTFTDVTHRKRMEAELRRVAETDDLTGIPNRRHFLEMLEREAARARRHGRPLALLALDLDHFKRINDEHGHAAGDAALRRFAAICTEALRGEDVLGRMGGEEFVAFLPETDQDGAAATAERLRRAVAEDEVTAGAASFRLTVSIGVAALAAGEVNAALMRADRALYAAKTAGRNRVALA